MAQFLDGHPTASDGRRRDWALFRESLCKRKVRALRTESRRLQQADGAERYGSHIAGSHIAGSHIAGSHIAPPPDAALHSTRPSI